MLRLEGSEPTTRNIRTYQAEKLGRFAGNTLLTELMPIPKSKVRHWDYEELIPQFASREEYYRVVKPRRIELIRVFIEGHKPRVVIGYGKEFWEEYRDLFEGREFKQEGQFQTAVFGDRLVSPTSHFAARGINGRFYDW